MHYILKSWDALDAWGSRWQPNFPLKITSQRSQDHGPSLIRFQTKNVTLLSCTFRIMNEMFIFGFWSQTETLCFDVPNGSMTKPLLQRKPLIWTVFSTEVFVALAFYQDRNAKIVLWVKPCWYHLMMKAKQICEAKKLQKLKKDLIFVPNWSLLQ